MSLFHSRRVYRVNLRLNTQEKAVVIRAAKSAGKPPSTFGRKAVLAAAQAQLRRLMARSRD